MSQTYSKHIALTVPPISQDSEVLPGVTDVVGTDLQHEAGAGPHSLEKMTDTWILKVVLQETPLEEHIHGQFWCMADIGSYTAGV